MAVSIGIGGDNMESEAERMPVNVGVGRTTRDYLRDETASGHDMLDSNLGALMNGDREDYAKFLAIQYFARRGVEGWLSRHGPDIAPPTQSHLIARDLSALGVAAPDVWPAFQPPTGSDPLGVCWVIAGSSLGNRAILAGLKKKDIDLPVGFLSDGQMTAHWRSLKPLLEKPHHPGTDEAILRGARAVFAHFNAVVAENLGLETV